VGDDAYRTFSLLPQSNNMKCSHIHFQLASLQTVETLHDGLLRMSVGEECLSLCLATHEMEKTIGSIRNDAKETTVIALISHPAAEGASVSVRNRVTVDPSCEY
jgi:hypothetical protein